MAESTLYAGTGANFNDGGTTVWSNPTNAQGDTTNTAATVNIGVNGGTSQRLRLSNFGFNVPTDGTILGVLVSIERRAANTARHYWNNIQLLNSGVEEGDNKSDGTVINAVKSFTNFGGNADLWGLSLTPTIVNNNGFGVSIKINRSGTATTTSIFRANITVYYQLPGAIIKAYNGAEFIDGVLKRYNGTTWENAVLKRYNGTEFILV
jgi:hypothetical protein